MKFSEKLLMAVKQMDDLWEKDSEFHVEEIRQMFEIWIKKEYSNPNLSFSDKYSEYTDYQISCMFMGFLNGFWIAEGLK